MHAEQAGSMGRAYSSAAAVLDGAGISPSADAILISTDSKEAGLWLWQGDAPPPSRARPKSRDKQFLRRIMPTARWAGWIALPTGLALTLIAVSLVPRADRPVSADTPAVALSPNPSLSVARPIVADLSAKLAESQLNQVQEPSPPATKITARVPEPRTAKWHAQHKSSRTAKKTSTPRVRSGPHVSIPGVLTPPLMTRHGGGD
jgi:hypothetical protein